ncbi:zf-HC2 domain-containing protein [Streptomyces sp. XC 2026]|uniref:zf-HC2 domain-containing protein n=1 Tax=Streptomyces sp. XC 2026 TaxID=2782004 RepID=UPI0019030211|nr:zf-HC2 domain-containing protein [Streptomyces sp. XC 2026]QQN77932.1 zf-HC2 domain-containing protein [Streptomyces sp. XC 2026]
MTAARPGGREPGDQEPAGGGAGSTGAPRVPTPRGGPGAGGGSGSSGGSGVGPAPVSPARRSTAPRQRTGPRTPNPVAAPGPEGDGRLTHQELMSLLGVWALDACSPAETACVEAHLNECARCAEEALRLRDAVTLLEPPRSLDLDPQLRPRVLESALARRPPVLPVPGWAAPYDAEAARLDALLHDINANEWDIPVRVHWFAGDERARRSLTIAQVLDHLVAMDGLLARAVGLPDPLGEGAPGDPLERTEATWRLVAGTAGGTAAEPERLAAARAWARWREQSRELVRTAARQGGRTGERMLPATACDPGLFPGLGAATEPQIPLSDAYLNRAFACWTHAGDIARAVDYPYEPPLGSHLRLLVDLTARRLPGSIAGRRRAGLATTRARLTTAGSPGRTVHLEIEGAGGGDYWIPLDSPTAAVTRVAARDAVAQVALEDVEFCQLAAGRLSPAEAAAGGEGDQAAITDVLNALTALSRL